MLLVLYLLPFTLASNSEYLLEWLQVTLIISAFFLGSWLIKSQRKYSKPIDYNCFYVPKLGLLIAVVLLYLFARAQLIEEVVMHLLAGDYASWTLSNAVARYEYQEGKSAIFQLGTVLFLTYAFLLGAYGRGKKVLYLYVVLAVIIFIESSELARAGVLLGITGLCVEALIRGNKIFANMKTLTYLKTGIFVSLGLFIVFIFSAYFRVASSDDALSILLDKFMIYTIAMYQALYVWMQQTDSYGSGMGFFTFTAIYKMFGADVEQGFYPFVPTEFGMTNIYTSLRGFLSDLGLVLTVISFFIFGILVTYYSYVQMRVYAYMFVRLTLYHLLFVLYSPFLFSTVFVAFVLSGVLIYSFRDKDVLLRRS